MATRSKLAVILHADVVGSTALVRRDEEWAHEVIRDAFRRLSSMVGDHDGRTQELRGDALVAEFERPSDAIGAALSFQDGARRARRTGGNQPPIRIGIAMGEVVVADGTVTGAGVILAQRLEQLADPDGVVVQASVAEMAPTRFPFNFEALDEQDLKGFDEPVRACVASIRPGEFTAESEAPTPDPTTRDPTSPGDASRANLRGKPTVAVLPFVSMGSDSGQEHFADGMTDDIITELTRTRTLSVIARTSAFSYKNTNTTLHEIAQALKVRYVLEGSARTTAGRLRLNVRLVEASSGRHVWAERFDRDIADIFAIQDEMTTLIVGALGPEIDQSERSNARRRPPDSLDAWGHYHRGLDHMYKRTRQDDAAAEREFRRAVELDDGFAAPLAALAYTLGQVIYRNAAADAFAARIGEAIELANEAIVLDGGDALAYCALGRALYASQKFERAVEAGETAVHLNPSSATCRRSLGFTLLHSGDASAAIPEFKLGLKLSPRDPERWSFCQGISMAHLAQREFDEALVWIDRSLAAPNSVPWTLLARAAILGCLGRADEAGRALAVASEHISDLSIKRARALIERISRSSIGDVMAEGLAAAGLRAE